MKTAGTSRCRGGDAAELYTTYGVPPELFETLAAEHNLAFDWARLQREMEEHGIDSGGGQRRSSCSKSQSARCAQEDACSGTSSSATKRPKPKLKSSASSPKIICANRWTKSATRQPIDRRARPDSLLWRIGRPGRRHRRAGRRRVFASR